MDIITRRSFRTKIILPTVIVLVVLVIVLNIFLSLRFTALGNNLIDEKLLADSNGLNLYMFDSKANTNVAAISMALNSEAIAAIRQRDTKEIQRVFSSAHELYNVDYFTITDEKGTVLLRTYDPENSGDSIINQQNIVDALNGRISSYFESGTAVKVAVRTGAPVYDTDGKLIGAVSAGVRFDTEEAVEKLKNLFNSDVTVFLDDTRIATTIVMDGQNIKGTTLDPQIAKIVIENGQEYFGDADVLGEKFKTFYKPLLNFNNEAFAAIVLGIPTAELIAASKKSIRDGIILGLGGLAISICLLFIIITTISKPITKLSNDMNQIASGNLHISVNVNSEDEVGLLGKSLQKVADILHSLLEDINIMISEHNKGNTHYHFDTEEFLGDYKMLAESIVELSSVGMLDQLTEIPNRRSFDKRMDMEWNRATREAKPISMLILDVDKFKTYNDTFGHQQGDMALKTVAKTLSNAIKRTTDFTARWGGEEFVVLLPGTDSTGATGVGELIRKDIEKATIPCEDPRGLKVTVSIGANTVIPQKETTMESFVSGADNALYKAKEAGRNRVVHIGENLS